MTRKGRILKTEGIVLKRLNMGEQDRMVTILTPQLGKLKILAKGVRRVPSRRAGHLEVFTHGEFILYEGKTFDHLQEAQGKTVFGKITSDLHRTSYGYYLLELTDRLLPEKQESFEVYVRLLHALHTVNESENETAYAEEIYRYALDLLWMLGYLPRTQKIPSHDIFHHIETIIERKLKTPKLIEQTR